MSPYRITFHDAEDALVSEQVRLFQNDDAAIDHAGGVEHEHAVRVWQDDRLVAHFPPAYCNPRRAF